MDELQTDVATSLTDNNLVPVYKINYRKKEMDMICNRIKTKIEYPDPKAMTFVTRDQMANQDFTQIDNNSSNLICRSENNLVYYKDPTSRIRLINKKEKMMECGTSIMKGNVVDPLIHFKQFTHRYYFGNPTEFMAVIFRPLIHIMPHMRKNNNLNYLNYFPGEYQWSNFSVYPFYDHTQIINAKNAHYESIKNRVYSHEDKKYGFIKVIDNLIINYQNTCIDVNNLCAIKTSYINFPHSILPKYHLVRLKEIILNLSPNNYTECEIDHLLKLIDQCLDTQIPNSPKQILKLFIEKYENIPNDILEFTCTIREIYFDEFALHKDNANRTIELVQEILLQMRDNHHMHVKYLEYKNIIWQIGVKNIPYAEIKIICAELNNTLNYMLNNTWVEMIDYEKSLVPIPKINPLVNGLLKFNNYERNPVRSDTMYWSTLQPYWNMPHSPEECINIFSWAVSPFNMTHAGTANLSKIDDFTGVYDIHPQIGTDYPAEMVTFVQSLNINRFLSGQSGKAWQYTSANMR
jgi:hypothetical protein